MANGEKIKKAFASSVSQTLRPKGKGRIFVKRKTVLVTGSSRGIGRAAALKFAREGWNVVINCVAREKQLEEVKREILACGVDCLAFLGDVSRYDVCQQLFQQAKQRFCHVDAVVNNAGISHIGLFQDMKPEEWERIIRVNLGSVFNCTRLAVPEMIANKMGSIVNISSVWGIAGASCEAAYSASKGAVNALTKALAKELGPSNVRVNAVACGAIDTEMNQFLDLSERRALEEEIPMSRFGKPEEVAELVYDLTCKETYLTGQVVVMDGGWI